MDENKDRFTDRDRPLQILLLTNRDSDNLGDWMIDLCDVALVDLIMKNLGIPKERYCIRNHAVSRIVPKTYLVTEKGKYLKAGRSIIEQTDLIIFGGAPMFNYRYQVFYKRTATVLKLAQKAKKPVIFSAIGIEKYQDTDPKCLMMKEALQFSCVKQITTRDDFTSLKEYAGSRKIPIKKVADPAVYTAEVFRDFLPKPDSVPMARPGTQPDSAPPTGGRPQSYSMPATEAWKQPDSASSAGAALPPASAFGKEPRTEGETVPEAASPKKRIGLFVLRAGGFLQNAGSLGRQEMALFWKQLAKQLRERGYTYTLLGSGNYGDEAFLDEMIRQGSVRQERCRFNLTSPEDLVQTIASFDAVVSCRLHPSILSWSLGVPSLGIAWNDKVPQFYETIGYGDRVFAANELDPAAVADRIEEILDEPLRRDEAYRYTVYQTLFDGIRKRKAVKKFMATPEQVPRIYTPQEVAAGLSAYPGTAESTRAWYAKRKNRRIYEEMNLLKQKKESFILIYHSSRKDCSLNRESDPPAGKLMTLPSGVLEYRLEQRQTNNGMQYPQKDIFLSAQRRQSDDGNAFSDRQPNDGSQCPQKDEFLNDGGAIKGWHIRIKNGNRWYWYLDGGILCPKDVWKEDADRKKLLLEQDEPLPYFALESLDVVVLEAVWASSEIMIKSQKHKR